jgi:hypothetical protein
MASARPAREAQPDYTLSYVLGGTTAALLVGSVVTGIVALAKRDDYNTRNRFDVSSGEKQHLRDAASTWAWVNTGLWAGTVMAAGATAVAFFVAPVASRGPERSVGLQLTASGRF